jgi:hypothetical protein
MCSLPGSRIFPAMSEDIRPRSAGGSTSLRASDEDRDRLATDLRGHAVAGRLSTEEFEQRLAQAYGARTLGELAELERDLPASPESLALAERDRRAHLVRRSLQETGGSFGLFVMCCVIWGATGAGGFFWPIFVIIPFLLTAVRSGWELFGPAADLDAVEAKLDARAEHHREHDHHDHGRRDRGRRGHGRNHH